MIFEEPSPGPEETTVLRSIRHLWTQLQFNLQNRPARWTGLLSRNFRAAQIRSSNRIEGFFVTKEDALAAVDGEESPAEADEESWLNVVHYREGMDYIMRLSSAPDFQFSRDLIRSLHFIMVRHDPRANPGTWRPDSVYIRNSGTGEVVYEGPSAESISDLVHELCVYLTQRDAHGPRRMLRAAMAHLNLVMIHPFSDGNGRMSRALQTLVLARGGVFAPTFSSIEEYVGKARNIDEYYQVLAQVGGGSWDPTRDVTPWIRFCLKAHYRQAMFTHRRLNAVSAIGAEIEGILKKLGVDDRAAVPLVNAALGERIRNPSYRKVTDVSMVVASRDLNELVKRELLEAVGEKRGRSYRATPMLRSIRAKHLDPSPIEDPFEDIRSLPGVATG